MNETAKRPNGKTARQPLRHFRDLDVYQNALGTGLRIYELTKRFPVEERYALTDQIRRSSGSVRANIAEAGGGSAATKLRLSLNSAMRKVKQPPILSD